VLQGVYQSHQATAAAVQVNNINLIRGLIGKPGSGVLQMNGQPTAQNTRECGADGDLPGFRNWDNPEHVQQLADLWNIEKEVLPAWKPPTHALEIFRYAEKGSLKMLWISATNPVVSLPDLHRVRATLAREELFVVAQDGFVNETTSMADVVLPAAIWAEKTGCFTNVDRTVHLSHQAIEPPGEAKSDLDIFIDYARRMGFKDKDGQPLIKWSTPEEAFDAWRECTRGQLCDYSGMSYEKLTGGSGIQWPCNDDHPDGATHLYPDQLFRTAYDKAENFGHDLETGAAVTPKQFKALNPAGRAILKPADYLEPHEVVDQDYPLWLTTGRLVYHFHTRTKTAQSRELNEAAPDSFIQMNEQDAVRLGIRAGDMLEVESRRGRIYAPAQIGDIEPGHLFTPFHYGYWDNNERPRAANELTLYEWDPVSKQPYYKYSAVRLRKMADGEPFRMDDPLHDDSLKPTSDNPRQHVADYLGLLHDSSKATAKALSAVAAKHQAEPDIGAICQLLAEFSREHTNLLKPSIERYGEKQEHEADALLDVLQPSSHDNPLSLLRDLHDCWLLVQESHISFIVLTQAAKALRDEQLLQALNQIASHNKRQRAWLKTRIKQAAPQTLIVPS
jgi:ferredoxin-nitrate reductase